MIEIIPPTDTELFHEATLYWGGRLDLDRVPQKKETLSRRLSMARQAIAATRAIEPRVPTIYFDYIDMPDVQAFAFRSNGRHFIGVSGETFIILDCLFQRMLSDRRTLTHIGDPASEKDMPPVDLLMPTDLLQHERIVPVDHERQLYAMLLTDIASEFLVAHEFAHIYNGHVDYWDQEMAVQFMPEFGWSASNSGEKLTRQTLEMDADCIATCNGIRRIRRIFTDPGFKLQPPWDRFFTTPRSAFFAWGIAVSSFFRLFGDDTLTESTISTECYPPSRIRQYIATITANTYVVEKWDQTLRGDLADLNNSMPEAERAFAHMTGKPPNFDGIVELVKEPACWKYADALQSYWTNELRAKLEPFAYGDLPG